MMRGSIMVVNEMEFLMLKQTERLSPLSCHRAVQRFLRARRSGIDNNYFDATISCVFLRRFTDNLPLAD
jgi:hypothetical protein